MQEETCYRIRSKDLDQIFANLKQRDYSLIGPVIRDGVVVYDDFNSLQDLPRGWTDEQGPAHYSLQQSNQNKEGSEGSLFEYVVGPQSWKKYLVPPVLKLWDATRSDSSLSVKPVAVEVQRRAFIGVRSCELKAIEIQDRIFLSESYQDPHYRSVRDNTFIFAVDCTRSASTCFCVSMNSGPEVRSGFDLALTEVVTDSESFFILRCGSELGREMLDKVALRSATNDEQARGEAAVGLAREQQRRVNTEGIKERLYQQAESKHWDDVAARCLGCTNCTMVCPTCFCSTVEDTTALDGSEAGRVRKLDSCFSEEFSYIHGGSIRSSMKSRYRQWLTHKFAAWIDQFGTSGCVGCGRCITWCPVGIDITQELSVLENSAKGKEG